MRIGIQQELDNAQSFLFQTNKKLGTIPEFFSKKYKLNEYKFSKTEKEPNIDIDKVLFNSKVSLKHDKSNQKSSFNKNILEEKYRFNSIDNSPLALKEENKDSLSIKKNSKNKFNSIDFQDGKRFKKAHSADQNAFVSSLKKLNYNYNFPNINYYNNKETFGVDANQTNQKNDNFLILKNNKEENNLKLHRTNLSNSLLNESNKKYNSGTKGIEKKCEIQIPFNTNLENFDSSNIQHMKSSSLNKNEQCQKIIEVNKNLISHIHKGKKDDKDLSNLSNLNQVNIEGKEIPLLSSISSFDVKGRKLHFDYLNLKKERMNLVNKSNLETNKEAQLNMDLDYNLNLNLNPNLSSNFHDELYKQDNIIANQSKEITQLVSESDSIKNIKNGQLGTRNISQSQIPIFRSIEHCQTLSYFFDPSQNEKKKLDHFNNQLYKQFHAQEIMNRKNKSFLFDSCQLLDILFVKNNPKKCFELKVNKLNISPKHENEIAFQNKNQKNIDNIDFSIFQFQSTNNLSIIPEIESAEWLVGKYNSKPLNTFRQDENNSDNIEGANEIDNNNNNINNINRRQYAMLIIEVLQGISIKLIKENEIHSSIAASFNDLEESETNPIAMEEEVKFNIFNQNNSWSFAPSPSNFKLIQEQNNSKRTLLNIPSEESFDSINKNGNLLYQRSRRDAYDYLKESKAIHFDKMTKQNQNNSQIRYWSRPRYLRETPMKVQQDKMLITVKKPLFNLESSNFKEIVKIEPNGESSNMNKDRDNNENPIASNILDFCQKSLCLSRCCYNKGEEVSIDEMNNHLFNTPDKYLNQSTNLDQKDDNLFENKHTIFCQIPRKNKDLAESQIIIKEDKKESNLLNVKNNKETKITFTESIPSLNKDSENNIIKNENKKEINIHRKEITKEIISPSKKPEKKFKSSDLSLNSFLINYKSFAQEKEIDDIHDLKMRPNPFEEYTRCIDPSLPIPPRIEIKQIKMNEEIEKSEESN